MRQCHLKLIFINFYNTSTKKKKNTQYMYDITNIKYVNFQTNTKYKLFDNGTMAE